MFTTWYDLNRGAGFPLFRRETTSGVVPRGNHRRDPLDLTLWEDDDALVVTARVPGFARDAIELTLHENVLTVSGERPDDLPEGARALRRERGARSFRRVVALPVRVDADAVSAELVDGVLTVRLAVARDVRPRRIAVA